MKNLSIIALSGIITIGCSTSSGNSDKSSTAGAEDPISSITLTKAPSSPEFPDATLTKANLKIEETDSLYSLNYSFDVANYELGAQTEDAATRGIANSGKGQHIHYIVNNGPYAAHYMADVPDQLEGGYYVVLAFLSRSYHESVKSEGAYFVEGIWVGDEGVLGESIGEVEEFDPDEPNLFYSRPKGTYKGADAEKVMLDFYLLNTTLSPDGNKVKANINEKEFMIEEWAPYYIEGLPMGESTIKLELIDAEGNAMNGLFNSVERTITLKE